MNRRNIRTSRFGFETVSIIGAILWNDLPVELKNAESLKTFKQKIKLWSLNNCPCKICISNVKSTPILSADFLHAMVAGHAEDFQIYVLE